MSSELALNLGENLFPWGELQAIHSKLGSRMYFFINNEKVVSLVDEDAVKGQIRENSRGGMAE